MLFLEAQQFMSNNSMETYLVFIYSNHGFIQAYISKLETQHVSLIEALYKVKKLRVKMEF